MLLLLGECLFSGLSLCCECIQDDDHLHVVHADVGGSGGRVSSPGTCETILKLPLDVIKRLLVLPLSMFMPSASDLV